MLWNIFIVLEFLENLRELSFQGDNKTLSKPKRFIFDLRNFLTSLSIFGIYFPTYSTPFNLVICICTLNINVSG